MKKITAAAAAAALVCGLSALSAFASLDISGVSVPLGLPETFIRRGLGEPSRVEKLDSGKTALYWSGHGGFFVVASGDVGRIVERGRVAGNGRADYDRILAEIRAYDPISGGENIFGEKFSGAPGSDDGTNRVSEGTLADGRHGVNWSLDGDMWEYRLLINDSTGDVTVSEAQDYITVGPEAATWSVEPITRIFRLSDAPINISWAGGDEYSQADGSGWTGDRRTITMPDGSEAVLVTFWRGMTVAQYLLMTEPDDDDPDTADETNVIMSRWKSRDWHSSVPGLGIGMTREDLILMRGEPLDIRAEFSESPDELHNIELFIGGRENTMLYWAYDQGKFDEINRVHFEDGRLSEVSSIQGVHGVSSRYIDSEARRTAEELYVYADRTR